MKRPSLTTRLQPLLAILFAVGVLSAPAWHAAQAAQPAECCLPSQMDTPAPPADQADAACSCCPGDTTPDAPQPTPTDDEPAQPADDVPCPDDGPCPCCKNLLVVSPVAPIQTGVAITDMTAGDTLAAAIVIQPDSHAVAIDIRPPIG